MLDKKVCKNIYQNYILVLNRLVGLNDAVGRIMEAMNPCVEEAN